ncbi:major facilitator superfamily protein [Komagataeibacter europaeus]|uniref:Major facilitator superfamily protein n=3 Tax=Komagataeibacter europaeus TaxID=33995 RepID=A0A0M0ECU2_KOMEU|nr:major facilitator superfamily protein [Komagataeibacter europaeus]
MSRSRMNCLTNLRACSDFLADAGVFIFDGAGPLHGNALRTCRHHVNVPLHGHGSVPATARPGRADAMMVASSRPGRYWLPLAALVIFSAVSSIMSLGAPALAGVLTRGFHLTSAEVGFYFLVELGSVSLVSIPAIWLVPRIRLRRAMAGGVAIFIIFNLLSWCAPDYTLLLFTRAGAAAGEGFVMILTMTGISLLPRQEMSFGFWVAGQLILSAMVIVVFPVIADHSGACGVYAFVGLLMTLAIPCVFWLPDRTPAALHTGEHTGFSLSSGLRVLGVLCFYLGLSGVWTFLEKIGMDSGLSRGATDQFMATAALFGIAGGLCASAVGHYLSRRASSSAYPALLTGYGMIIVAVAALLGHIGWPRFFTASCLFKFGWTFVVPFVLARVAQHAAAIETMAIVNLTIGAGFAFGPAISGYLLQATGHDDALIMAGECLMLLSAFLVMHRSSEQGMASTRVSG